MGAAADRAYQLLRNEIFRGTIPTGSWLREEEIAARLEVSRSPVREALRRLANERLVELVPNRGAVVSQWDEGELYAILDIRAMLEGYGIRRSATRISDADIDHLQQLCAESERIVATTDPDRMRTAADLSQEFHMLILSAAGSTRLVNTLSGLSRVPLLFGVHDDVYEAAMARSLRHHREIVEALRARDDGWAEAAMTAHIRAARAAHRDPESGLVPATPGKRGTS